MFRRKKTFIEIGFGRELLYDGSIYRTAYLNPIFEPKALILKRKSLLEYNKKTGSSLEYPLRGERRVSNPRPSEPQSDALTN